MNKRIEDSSKSAFYPQFQVQEIRERKSSALGSLSNIVPVSIPDSKFFRSEEVDPSLDRISEVSSLNSPISDSEIGEEAFPPDELSRVPPIVHWTSLKIFVAISLTLLGLIPGVIFILKVCRSQRETQRRTQEVFERSVLGAERAAQGRNIQNPQEDYSAQRAYKTEKYTIVDNVELSEDYGFGTLNEHQQSSKFRQKHAEFCQKYLSRLEPSEDEGQKVMRGAFLRLIDWHMFQGDWACVPLPSTIEESMSKTLIVDEMGDQLNVARKNSQAVKAMIESLKDPDFPITEFMEKFHELDQIIRDWQELGGIAHEAGYLGNKEWRKVEFLREFRETLTEDIELNSKLRSQLSSAFKVLYKHLPMIPSAMPGAYQRDLIRRNQRISIEDGGVRTQYRISEKTRAAKWKDRTKKSLEMEEYTLAPMQQSWDNGQIISSYMKTPKDRENAYLLLWFLGQSLENSLQINMTHKSLILRELQAVGAAWEKTQDPDQVQAILNEYGVEYVEILLQKLLQIQSEAEVELTRDDQGSICGATVHIVTDVKFDPKGSFVKKMGVEQLVPKLTERVSFRIGLNNGCVELLDKTLDRKVE